MGKKSLSGVVLKEIFVKVRRGWMLRFILMNLFYIIVIAALSMVITVEKKRGFLFLPCWANYRGVPDQR